MKRLPALLLGSLALNAAIVALLAWRPAATRAFFRDAFASSPSAAAPLPAPKPKVTPRETSEASAAALAAIDWKNLQPADYTAIGAQLAAMGFPPHSVRAIQAILIHTHYNERRRELRPQLSSADYWRNPNPRPTLEEGAAERELHRERTRVVREVLGGDFDLDDDASSHRRRYGSLSSDKVAKLQKIFADYSDLEEQLFADAPDRGAPELRARSDLLAKEKRADIERLLTAEELLDYDLRNSPASHRLRSRLGAFQATEAEFRALYPAFKAAADATAAARPPTRSNAVESRRAREAAERQLDEELRRVLGDARFAELQEANDHGLQETREFVASLNLPASALTEIVAVQKEFQPRITAVERDRDLSPNQRDAQLGALASEARTRLTRVLGPSGFEAYKRRGGGWLGLALTRAAPTPSAAP